MNTTTTDDDMTKAHDDIATGHDNGIHSEAELALAEDIEQQENDMKTYTTGDIETGMTIYMGNEIANVISVVKGWITLDTGLKIRAKAITGIMKITKEPITKETVEEFLKPKPKADDEKPTMAEQLAKARAKYTKVKDKSGKWRISNGDELATLLVDLTPEQVMVAAEKWLGLPDGELVNKYGHLNPGQQRMNSGNRMRNFLKKGGDLKALAKLVG